MYTKDQCHNQLLLTATQLRTQHLWDRGGRQSAIPSALLTVSVTDM